MIDFFSENLPKIKLIFPSAEQQEQLQVINDNIFIDDQEDSRDKYSDLIYLPSGLAIADVFNGSTKNWQESIQTPVRFLTPAFSFSDARSSTVGQAFSSTIDVEDRPLLEFLLRQKNNSNSFTEYHSSPTYVVFGILTLVGLDDFIDQLPNFSSILVVEHSLERVACAFKMFSLDKLLEKIKLRNSGFSIIFEEKSEDLIAAFQRHILNISPSVAYNMHLISPVIPSAVLTRFQGWLESPQGGKAIVELLFGNETDELNQLANYLLNCTHPETTKLFDSSYYASNSADLSSNHSVILTASGPSLDDEISFLKDHSSAAIVAAGSSVGTLLRNGIQPTAVVLLEMASVVYYDLLQLLVEGYDLSNIVLIGSLSIDPRIKKLFKSFVAFSRPSMATATLLDDQSIQSCLPQAGPQVANAALEVVLSLGYKNLYLCGCDFASPSNSHGRSVGAVGNSFRNLDIPVECRGSGTVFTDAELMVTAQFFSEMMTAYAAKAVTKGKGVPLKNTNFNSGNPDLEFVSSVDFASKLEAACTDLRFSEANLSSLRKMGDVGDQIFNELSELLADHTSWNRALQASIDSYMAFERPQTEPVNRKLFLRCYRSLFFMMFRALASDCDPSVFSENKRRVLDSLKELKDGSSSYFKVLMRLISNPLLAKSYEPKVIASLLLN